MLLVSRRIQLILRPPKTLAVMVSGPALEIWYSISRHVYARYQRREGVSTGQQAPLYLLINYIYRCVLIVPLFCPLNSIFGDTFPLVLAIFLVQFLFFYPGIAQTGWCLSTRLFFVSPAQP